MAANIRFKPRDLRVAMMSYYGATNKDIAHALGMHEISIGNILRSPTILEFIEDLKTKSIETMSQVAEMAQLAAPAVMEEKIRLALSARDERVRNTAAKDILEIAGHSPVKRVVVEKEAPSESTYHNKTEDELRAELLSIVGGPGASPAVADSSADTDETTLH